MPFFLPFLIKGIAVVGKAIIVHHKAAAATKVVTAAVKTYGAKTVAVKSAYALTTIGGITWTVQRYKDLEKCFELWESGDYDGFILHTAKLLMKLKHLDIKKGAFLDSLSGILTKNGHEDEIINQFIAEIGDNWLKIKAKMKTLN